MAAGKENSISETNWCSASLISACRLMWVSAPKQLPSEAMVHKQGIRRVGEGKEAIVVTLRVIVGVRSSTGDIS